MVPSAEPYSDQTVSVMKALVELAEFGIEPRHLRGMRSTAAREAALIEQAVKPIAGKRSVDAKSTAEATAQSLAGHIQSIREVLTQSALSGITQ